MPAEVIVDKNQLLEVLRKNRDNHREIFLKAQDGFRSRVIEELDRRLHDARAGRKISQVLGLPEPEDHTEDYDREIRMLEMHTGPEVIVSSHLFDQIVMDRWNWSASFGSTSTPYL